MEQRYVIASHGRSILALALAVTLVACGGGGDTMNNNAGSQSPASVASNTATIAWDPVNSPSLNGYRIYYGTSPGNYMQAVGQGLSVGNITSYTVTGLSGGTRYYFAVTAFDTFNNESDYSAEVSKDIL